MTNPTHGLCHDCLSEANWQELKAEKTVQCLTCQKEPTVLLNQEPYCTTCYLMMSSSPLKSEVSSTKGHGRHKSFYRPIDKSEYLKKSFLSSSGKLIRKIQKLFDEYKKDSNLLNYLAKKSLISGQCNWEKLVLRINKTGSIIYFFFSKTHIIGAFHLEPLSIEGQCSTVDEECGIFICDRTSFNPEFSRVKSNAVIYSSKNQTINFGSPSSLEISLEKDMKVKTQLIPNFQWMAFYVYRP